MSEGSVTAITAASLAAIQTPSAVQPTAQQAARFEHQLQTPASAEAAHYEIPSTETAGASGQWHSMMESIGHVSEQLRTQMGNVDFDSANSNLDGTSHGLHEALRDLAQMSYSMVNFQLINSAEGMVDKNVRTLYQQT